MLKHGVKDSFYSIIKNEDNTDMVGRATALSLAGVVNTVLNMVLQMLLTRNFTKSEVAVYSQTNLVCTTAIAILQVGIPTGIFYVLVRNKQRIKAIINESMLIILILGGFYATSIICGGNELIAKCFNNCDLAMTLLISIPYVVCGLVEAVMLAVLVFCNRIRFNSIYNIMKSLVIVVTLIVVIICSDKGIYLFTARTLIFCIVVLVCFFLGYRYIIPNDSILLKRHDFINILSVSLPLGFASLAGVLSTNLDNIVISFMLSPEVFSVYHIGAYELPFISVITGAIMTVVTVDMNEAIKNNDYAKALSIFSDIAKNTSYFLMPIMVFFFFAAKNFMIFMYTDEYIAAVTIFQCYLLYLPIRIVSYGPLLVALGKSKVLLRREVTTLILNALTSIVMIRLWGAIGACLGTIIITYLYTIPFNLLVISKTCKKKWYNILPFKHIFNCILFSIPGGIISYVIDMVLFCEYICIVRLFIMFVLFSSVTIIIYKCKFKLSINDVIGLVKRR